MPRHQSLTGNLLRAALVLAGVWATAQAQVSCFVSADPAIHKLQLMAANDATATLPMHRGGTQCHAWPAGTRSEPHGIAVRGSRDRPTQVLELDGDARTAALEGLQLVPDANNPVHVELLSVHSENVYDHAGIDTAIKAIEAARSRLMADSVAESCLRITLGTLAVSTGPRRPGGRQPDARLSNRRGPRAAGTAHDRRVRVVEGDARHGRLHAGAGAECGSHRLEYRAGGLAQLVGIPIPARLDSQGAAQTFRRRSRNS